MLGEGYVKIASCSYLKRAKCITVYMLKIHLIYKPISNEHLTTTRLISPRNAPSLTPTFTPSSGPQHNASLPGKCENLPLIYRCLTFYELAAECRSRKGVGGCLFLAFLPTLPIIVFVKKGVLWCVVGGLVILEITCCCYCPHKCNIQGQRRPK